MPVPDFLSGWNAQQDRNQRTTANDINAAAGAQGVLARLQQQKQQEQIQGILAQAPNLEAAVPMLMKAGPMGIQVAGQLAQLHDQQTKAQQAQREQAVFTPENIARNTSPGTPAIPMPADELGGGPGAPAQPGQVNIDALRRQAALTGPRGLEAYSQHVAAEEARKQAAIDNRMKQQEALQLRLHEIEMRQQDRALTREQQLFLANQADQTKKMLAAFAVANRVPRQEREPKVVDTADGMLVVGPNGTTSPLMGPDGKPVRGKTADKPVTEFQGKNMLYGTRAAQAHNVMMELEEKISTTGLAMKQAVANTPIVGGMLGAAGNVALSSNQQSVEQAQRNFVNAVLRQESGAVISDAEFANAKKQYFPQPGDDKPVLEQKRQNRLTVINGFRRIAGPAGEEVARALAEKPLAAGGASIPPPPPGFKVD